MMLARICVSLIVAGTAGVLVAAPPTTPAATGDAARGGKLFLQCAACHVVAPGAASTVGPNLSGVVGARAGARAGYSYSPALAGSGIVWSGATLDGFIKRPSQAVPGTKMAFAGVADPKSRADIIAYLTTLKGRK